MSWGKSSGQERSEIDTTGAGSAAAISSNAADVARTIDACACAISATVAASSRSRPSWWIGAAGMPGSINSIRRRSTTS